jgi:hypothetical protein
MSYAPPMVTIELREYQEMKASLSKLHNVNAAKWEAVAKQILFTFSRYRYIDLLVTNSLNDVGIHFSFSQDDTGHKTHITITDAFKPERVR